MFCTELHAAMARLLLAGELDFLMKAFLHQCFTAYLVPLTEIVLLLYPGSSGVKSDGN